MPNMNMQMAATISPVRMFLFARRRFIAGAVRLYRRADRRSALQLYLYSLAYLALLFCAMVVDVHL